MAVSELLLKDEQGLAMVWLRFLTQVRGSSGELSLLLWRGSIVVFCTLAASLRASLLAFVRACVVVQW